MAAYSCKHDTLVRFARPLSLPGGAPSPGPGVPRTAARRKGRPGNPEGKGGALCRPQFAGAHFPGEFPMAKGAHIAPDGTTAPWAGTFETWSIVGGRVRRDTLPTPLQDLTYDLASDLV